MQISRKKTNDLFVSDRFQTITMYNIMYLIILDRLGLKMKRSNS